MLTSLILCPRKKTTSHRSSANKVVKSHKSVSKPLIESVFLVFPVLEFGILVLIKKNNPRAVASRVSSPVRTGARITSFIFYGRVTAPWWIGFLDNLYQAFTSDNETKTEGLCKTSPQSNTHFISQSFAGFFILFIHI